MRAMATTTAGLVDILRDFLAVDAAIRGLLDRYRRGELRFGEIQELFADDEASPLFRLKERCHLLFRSGAEAARVHPREVLFDLAVGSLFHEAMKFRESFYQHAVYGPRVRALREEAGSEGAALFEEFERIFAMASERLEEGVAETEALLERTREQLPVLLAQHPENGHVVRFLVERRRDIESVFGESLDALLARIHGDAASGYALAGRSYLASGYYAEAKAALDEAIARGGERARLEPDRVYARGMTAYLRGDYAESIVQLERWLASDGPWDPRWVDVASSAIAKIDELIEGPGRQQTLETAHALGDRLAALRAPAGVKPRAAGA